jgi:mono/diheme cytochrome c family protein
MRAPAPLALFALALLWTKPGNAGESADYLFRLHCSGCHGLDGAGSKTGRVPQFQGIVGHFANSNAGRLYLVHVPGVSNAALPDDETARVLNYVLRKWPAGGVSADLREFTAKEVNSLRKVHIDNVASLRNNIATELAQHGISIEY